MRLMFIIYDTTEIGLPGRSRGSLLCGATVLVRWFAGISRNRVRQGQVTELVPFRIGREPIPSLDSLPRCVGAHAEFTNLSLHPGRLRRNNSMQGAKHLLARKLAWLREIPWFRAQSHFAHNRIPNGEDVQTLAHPFFRAASPLGCPL